MTARFTTIGKPSNSRDQTPAATPVARLQTDEQSARRIAALLPESFETGAPAVSIMDIGSGRWQVAIHFHADPDEKLLRALTGLLAGSAAADALSFERTAAKDWVAESLATLKPVEAGRFIVHGAHDRVRVPVNRIGIEIEAALAFGTGHHGSTRGCLIALDHLCKALSKPLCAPAPAYPCKGERIACACRSRKRSRAVPRIRSGAGPRHFRGRRGFRILDLGTGSGVLAIAAASVFHQRILATDIDASAVATARANAQLNAVAAIVEVIKADGIAGRLRARAPFDLVLANVLLRPLQRFAAPFRKIIGAGGRVVLSGLLPSQANAAIAAYRGLALEQRVDVDGWTTLVLRRPIAVARSRSAQ